MNLRLLCLTLSISACGESISRTPYTATVISTSKTYLAQDGTASLTDVATVSFAVGATDKQMVDISLVQDSELSQILTKTAAPFYNHLVPSKVQLVIDISNIQPDAPVNVSINIPLDIKAEINAGNELNAFILAQHTSIEERMLSVQPIPSTVNISSDSVALTLNPDDFRKTTENSYQAVIYLTVTDKPLAISSSSNACGISLVYPVKYQPNQNFGSSVSPQNSLTKHYGLDFPAPAGTPVLAMADGIITKYDSFSSSLDNTVSGWGNYLVIQHTNGSRSLYTHLAINNFLPTGSFVAAGSTIGESGNTTGSRKSHLHIEFLPATGSPRLKVDPSGCFTPDSNLTASPRPDPVVNPTSSIMLDIAQSGTKPAIDSAQLPVITGDYTVISPKSSIWTFKLHNYLTYYNGMYWAMWSEGVGEDQPAQHVQYATSLDGINWTAPTNLTEAPSNGYAYIARGFWVRNNELLALVAHFVGPQAFGINKDLQLQAFSLPHSGSPWIFKGLVANNSISNFPPILLPNGQWIMVQRDARYNNASLLGGLASIDDWHLSPIVKSINGTDLHPDEPVLLPLADGTLSALFRNNGLPQRIFRSFSTDLGAHWTQPVETNFPNATSKFFSFRTSKGYWVMISNANPVVGRQELYLSTSLDGLTFNNIAKLNIPSKVASTYQYPHAIEHDGHLLVAFSRLKNEIDMLKIPMATVDAMALGN